MIRTLTTGDLQICNLSPSIDVSKHSNYLLQLGLLTLPLSYWTMFRWLILEELCVINNIYAAQKVWSHTILKATLLAGIPLEETEIDLF